MPPEQSTRTRAETALPMLADCTPAFRDDFHSRAIYGEIPAGSLVCSEGQTCGALAMVLSGSVRVRKTAENGREITLYRIEPGDSCVLTASCIISGSLFPARAITESDTCAVMVLAPDVTRWLAESEEWRTFLFGLVSRRLSQVISTVEEVAFRRMDVRVARHLLRLSDGSNGAVRVTHQEIASELGTSREVVSRILKDLEHDGLVTLGRGVVQLKAVGDLDRLSRRD